jgi:hypothetical protein
MTLTMPGFSQTGRMAGPPIRTAGPLCGRTACAGGRTAVRARFRDHRLMREVVRFLRANPQVLVLLVICLVLGLGTFLAVVFGIVSSHSSTTSGEPSGTISALHALLD